MLGNSRALSGAIVAALTLGAHAADLPTRAPAPAAAPAAPVFTWTGFYAGVNVGAGRQRTSADYPPQTYISAGTAYPWPADLFAGATTGNGVVGGVQAGYDLELASWVVGVQSSVDASSLQGSGFWSGSDTERLSQHARALGSVTGRVGYLVRPSLLAYAKGGTSWLNNRYGDSDNGRPSISASATHWGWVVGGGLEYAIGTNWSTFVEYNHADYGNHRVTLEDSTARYSWGYAYKNRVETVLAGLNYRFGK